MKKELNNNVFIAVIAVLVVGLGWFLWRSTEGELSSAGRARAYFQAQEREENARGSTLNKGLGAYAYREYVDKSGPEPNLNVVMPSPGGAGVPATPAPNASAPGSQQTR